MSAVHDMRKAMDKLGPTVIVHEMEQALRREFDLLMTQVPYSDFEVELIADIQIALDDELYTDAAEALVELEKAVENWQDSGVGVDARERDAEIERRIDSALEAGW